MPVPSSITDLSKNASDNSPQGTESAKGTIDDYFRAHGAFIRQLSDLLAGPTVSLVSAGTVNIGFAASANILITGTVSINTFDSIQEGTLRWVTFGGSLTLNYNPVVMQLPGAANIQTGAGDVALFKSLGGGNWKCLVYERISGTGAVAATQARDGYLKASDWLAFANKQAPLGFNPYPVTGGPLEGRLLLPQGSASAPSMSFAVEGGTDTGFYHVADGQFSITCNSVPTWSFSPSQTFTVRPLTVDVTTLDPYFSASVISKASQGLRIWLEGNGANPLKILRVSGGTLSIRNNADTAELMSLTDAGVLSAPVVIETSDESKKKAWQRVPRDLVERLAGIRKSGLFVWKRGGARGLGVGAQSLEQILPDAVHTDEHGSKAVQYGAAAMVSVVELARAVVDLRARLAELEAR